MKQLMEACVIRLVGRCLCLWQHLYGTATWITTNTLMLMVAFVWDSYWDNDWYRTSHCPNVVLLTALKQWLIQRWNRNCHHKEVDMAWRRVLKHWELSLLLSLNKGNLPNIRILWYVYRDLPELHTYILIRLRRPSQIARIYGICPVLEATCL